MNRLPNFGRKLTKADLAKSQKLGKAADWDALFLLLQVLGGRERPLGKKEFFEAIYDDSENSGYPSEKGHNITHHRSNVSELEVNAAKMWIDYIFGQGASNIFTKQEIVDTKAIEIIKRLFEFQEHRPLSFFDPVVALNTLATDTLNSNNAFIFEDLSNVKRMTEDDDDSVTNEYEFVAQDERKLLKQSHPFKLYLPSSNPERNTSTHLKQLGEKPIVINLAYKTIRKNNGTPFRAKIMPHVVPDKQFHYEIDYWRISQENNCPLKTIKKSGHYAFLAITNAGRDMNTFFGKDHNKEELTDENLSNLVGYLERLKQQSSPAVLTWWDYTIT